MKNTLSLPRLISVAALLAVTATVHAAPAANTPRPQPRYGTLKPVTAAVQQRDQAYSAKVTQEATAARSSTSVAKTTTTSTANTGSANTAATKNASASSATTNPTRSDLYQSMTRAEYQAKYPVTVK